MSKRITTEDFLFNARKKHGDRYDYSLSVYTTAINKVKIICKKHGVFENIPYNHIKGSGCQQCAYEENADNHRSSNESFISKCNVIHSGYYNYSKVDYKFAKEKVEIICPKHGAFWQRANGHLNGKGCSKCGIDSSATAKLKGKKYFLDKSFSTHGKLYDYSKVDYVNMAVSVEIVCKKHGSFYQTPDNHTRGNGCPLCSNEEKGLKKRLNRDVFLSRCSDVHGDLYDYSLADYIKSDIKTEIICKTHGSFFQSPNSHLVGHGCPICSNSVGEGIIATFLNKNKIQFFPQHSFSVNRRFKYDFFIPSHNLIIELHGKQHYSPVDFFGGIPSLLAQSKRDIIKKHYCLQNSIPFLEIPFWEQDNIENILSENINS